MSFSGLFGIKPVGGYPSTARGRRSKADPTNINSIVGLFSHLAAPRRAQIPDL